MAATYPDASLALVFLDDDHNKWHVANELRAWWPKVQMGGTLAGHDYDMPDVEHAVNEFADWLASKGQRVMVQTLGTSWGIKKDPPPTPGPSSGYPAVRFHKVHGERLVRTAEDAQRLGHGWAESIAEAQEVPAPEPEPEPDPAPDAPEETGTAPKGGKRSKR